MTLACLRCEGSGTVRHYLNRAGDYEKWHCPDCGGTGECEYAEPQLRAVIEKRRFQEREQGRTAAKVARAAMPWRQRLALWWRTGL